MKNNALQFAFSKVFPCLPICLNIKCLQKSPTKFRPMLFQKLVFNLS